MGTRHPILAREGWAHSAVAAVLAVLATWLAPWWLWLPAWAVLVFVLQFFRDPERVPPSGPDLVLSPADGKVVFAGKATDPYLDRESFKISVFMDVFSVHSNRSPVEGTVEDAWYAPGKFLNAALDKSSELNERKALWIRDPEGRDVTVVQVAGLVARRILCYVEKGDTLERGQRYGFIRFGSRVDVHLPPGDFEPGVALGDKLSAGTSVIGRFQSGKRHE
ncbi:MAG: phosphatidylserine decarboxylase [Arenicellales bacterium]